MAYQYHLPMVCCAQTYSFKLLLVIVVLFAAGCASLEPPKKEPLDTKVADIQRYDAFKRRELRQRAENELLAEQAEKDVWQILKNGFSLPTQTSPHAENYEHWLAKHPKHTSRLNKRVKLALPYIVQEIQNRKLPMELALVPMIESSMNTFATSHAGAAGIWQIMPQTGKWLGLRISGGIDERRNILESTRASLDYLEYLADYYGDNWALGITAYNAGNGNVNRALQKSSKPNSYQSPWKLPLKKESKEYFF